MICSEPFNPGYLGNENVCLTQMSPDVPEEQIHGEWIGLAKLSTTGASQVKNAMTKIMAQDDGKKASMIDLF